MCQKNQLIKMSMILVSLVCFKVSAQVPVLVKDINVGSQSSDPQFLTDYHNKLYFNTQTNEGLWVSDGTESGTYLAEDTTIIGNDFPTAPFIFKDKLYFNTLRSRAIWSKTDVDNSATIFLDGHNTFSHSDYSSTVLGEDLLLFVGLDYNLSTIQTSKLYRTDGTTASITEFGGLVESNNTPLPRFHGRIGNQMLMSAIETGMGRELYVTDGTTETTILLKELFAGIIGGLSDVSGGSSNILDGNMYFPGFSDDGTSTKVWKTDGTIAGTQSVAPLIGYKAPEYLKIFNGELYFFAKLGNPKPEHLWKYNPTSQALTQLTFEPIFSNISCFKFTSMENNGILYFPYESNSQGCELWRTDGTPTGTFQLTDINPGVEGSFPSVLISDDNVLYFTAFKAGFGSEIWKTDGTVLGTTMLVDLNPGNNSAGTFQMVKSNGEIFFMANDGVHGQELFKLEMPASDDIFKDGFEGPF